MGIRKTQIIGLKKEAGDFIKNNVKTIKKCCSCPNCTTPHIETLVMEKYDDASECGMFDDGPNLHKYQLKDNTWIYEVVQDSPWSSGPCIFLSLKHENGEIIEESLWSDEEIIFY